MQEKGQETAQKKDELHQQRKVELQRSIESKEKELKDVREKNKAEEEKLTGAFQSADRTYVDSLGSYDTDMKNHQDSLQMVMDALKEKEHERDQLKEEWEQRCEEQRKYNEI